MIHSVLIPWVTLREVAVEVEIPSPKVAVIRFQRGMQQGLLGRISRTSIMEYHAFGIISESRKSSCHYMICGVQGDFTKDLVANPPKTLWTRELKFGTLFLPLLSMHVFLTCFSWSRTCLRNVQERNTCLHGNWYRRSTFYLHPEPKLVLDLDRLRPRENIWANDYRVDSQAHRTRTNDSVGFQETRRATRHYGAFERYMDEIWS